METQEVLRTTIAEFFGTKPELVGKDFPISGPRIQSSMSRALLDAAIRRRTGIKATIVNTAKTYGEIEAVILGRPASTDSASPDGTGTTVASEHRPSPNITSATISTGATAVQCGVDIELLDNLPKTDDYWEHEFYKANFTRAEIAYCLMQASAAMHFCARWCAKEALKKCDSAFLAEDMSRIEIVSHESGAVSLRHLTDGAAADLPHALSLSHTTVMAVAVVVKHSTPPKPKSEPAPILEVRPTEVAVVQRNPGWWAIMGLSLLAFVACTVAAIALARTF